MTQRQVPLPVWALGYMFRVAGPFPARQRLSGRFERFVAERGYSATIKFDLGQRISLDLVDWLPRQLFMSGAYELPFSAHFCNVLKRGMTVFDVGAHIGVYSLLAAPRVGEGGMVHAFEPSSATFGSLRRNISINTFSNIIPVEEAAWRVTGERLRLYLSDARSTGLSSLSERIRDPSGRSEYVQTVALDDYVKARGIAGVDVIKVDAEGSELQILHGARKTLAEFSPTLFVEIMGERLSQQGARPRDVYSLLQDQGFLPFRLDGPVPRLADPGFQADAALVMFRRPGALVS